ncbi:UDP-galactopyranose mutase [Desulfosporosinus acidiphilus SJ4]|uniref:UDP-galactopyranose mutase n=1 Tax=Desulfosporosinus acidiphilus (strain DSM 22704 / JCM 16185 / SJ4) TaxID=646529 RepID=I4DB50_DESAJ|nr:UDP-galactopyranose mutase [Desulfosporosinus acidiphilus]AFM43024.1 UDP-galactopyranose mutase [Desulfosporosinus acidiphilus SJ4]
MKKELSDCLVIGCGMAGSVIARELAERAGKNVQILEMRNNIGGNMYDFKDEKGILIHRYGPHIFHTNSKRVFDYLSRFTSWLNYSHEVVGDIHGKLMPIPFNLNSLHSAYEPSKAARIEQKLITTYGINSKVPILELRQQLDPEIAEIAEFIYNNIFLYYTQKQWGLAPDEIDSFVTARVPVFISYDNRYFQDSYQGIPAESYTSLFEGMLKHPKIELTLNTDARKRLRLESGRVFFDDRPFNGTVIYTGPLDELFDCRYGRLPYRTLDFVFESHNTTWYQPKGTVNYPVDQDYTRITEFKHLTRQLLSGRTTIVKEYPRAYTGADDETPYYPIQNPENSALYECYRKLTDEFPNFRVLGRLAEYKYYNMDAIAEKALDLADTLIG